MLLEWVKGHETMKQETHTWISRMKMEGNEMADVAAKQAATDQIQDDDYPFEHSITFRHKESGVRCGLQGLIEWLREHSKNKEGKG